MQLDDMEMVITVSDAHSLSQAAERLFISRPALSQRISSLEARYGVKFFERTSSGVFPTPAGQILTKFAKRISVLENALAAELAAADECFNSTIQVGMSLNDGVALLPGLVKKFHDVYPDALVHLVAGYEPDLIEKVREGKLDFALLENPSIDEGDISRKALGLQRLVFCAPDIHPYNSVPQPVSVPTLLEWPMIIYEWDSGRHMVGNRHFRERYGISLQDHNMVAQFGTHEAMMLGVKAGLGWGSVPECIASRFRNEPGILWFKVDTDPMRYPVELAWLTDHAMSPMAEEFKAFIIENVPKGFFRKPISEDEVDYPEVSAIDTGIR